MPTYDFSTKLVTRLGSHLTTNSVGLGHIAECWNKPESYTAPLAVGTLLELLLLYTLDRKTLARPEGQRMLSEEDKRNRGHLAYKLHELPQVMSLDSSELELLRVAITVLPTEPNFLVSRFLDNPEV